MQKVSVFQDLLLSMVKGVPLQAPVEWVERLV